MSFLSCEEMLAAARSQNLSLAEPSCAVIWPRAA